MEEKISEFEYLKAIKANDEGTLRNLYASNYFKIEKYVLSNSGTTEDAKDVFQEAFIAVWQNVQLDKFHPQKGDIHELAGYLYRIAKNKWLDHLRSSHFKKIKRMSNDADSLPDDMPQEEDIYYIAEVKNKFKYLGNNCREVLTMFYYRKESMRVIAEKFDWTEATAKNNKYRCLQKLRELLKK